MLRQAEEYVHTQAVNRPRANLSATRDNARYQTGEERLAIKMLTDALQDVRSTHLDRAALAYGWLINMKSPLTSKEVCDILGIRRGRVFDFVSELPNRDALQRRLIHILSNDMSELIKRRPGESICIGGDTWVTVVTIKGRTVHLEIDAPLHVPIFPAEDDHRDASSPDLRS